MADGVTVANAFVQIMPSMEGATDNITSAILPGMSTAGTKAGGAFGTMFTGKVGTLLKGFGAAALGYLAFDALADSFTEVEAGFNKVIIATGATGEAAEELRKVYTSVSGTVVGSYEDIGSAVGELNTRLGLQGEELEAASQAAMKYAKINGVDAVKGIQDVTRMMNNAGISANEYAHVLDVMTVAAQQSGIDVGKLANSVNDNAASFKQLGFSTEESIAMLAKFEKEGVNSSQVLAGMKKGVANWTKEGKSAKEGFADFVKGVQDGSVTMEDAIELFGAKAGVSMYDAAQKGQLSFDDMYKAIIDGSDDALDTVYNDTLTAQEKFDVLGKKIQTGFYQIAEPIVDAIAPYMDDIIAAISMGVDYIVNDVAPKMKLIADAIASVIEFVANLVDAFNHAGENIGAVCVQIQGFFNDMESNALKVFESIRNFITSKISDARNFVLNAASEISNKLGFPALVSTVTSVFNAAKEAITHPIETARDIIKGIVEKIKGFFNFTVPTPHIPMPHFSISPSGWNVGDLLKGSIPSLGIEWYATGGFVDQPTLFGAGEAGTEMILPKSGGLMDDFSDAVTEKVDSQSIVDELRRFERMIGPIIADYAPGMTKREFDRAARTAVAYG